jgi:hypothetical protein
MKIKLLIIFTLLFTTLFCSHSSMAQDSAQTEISNAPPEPDSSTTSTVNPLSRLEFVLSITVLIFGLIIILLEIFLIRSKKISSDDSIKFITITLIITSTLFLITAGYSNDQIAPAVGLLGTIAGYLLGRIQPSKKEDKNEEPT